MFIRRRVRVDDARRVRVRANAFRRDANGHACASVRLRRANADDSDHRANVRAYAFFLRAYVRVRVVPFAYLSFC